MANVVGWRIRLVGFGVKVIRVVVVSGVLVCVPEVLIGVQGISRFV